MWLASDASSFVTDLKYVDGGYSHDNLKFMNNKKVVIVNGGSRGIGYGITKRLLIIII